MADKKQTPKRKKKPNKQKEFTAASLLRMAKDARNRANTIVSDALARKNELSSTPGGDVGMATLADGLTNLAAIFKTEARKLRKMR